jgi:hypothetical protein
VAARQIDVSATAMLALQCVSATAGNMVRIPVCEPLVMPHDYTGSCDKCWHGRRAQVTAGTLCFALTLMSLRLNVELYCAAPEAAPEAENLSLPVSARDCSCGLRQVVPCTGDASGGQAQHAAHGAALAVSIQRLLTMILDIVS